MNFFDRNASLAVLANQNLALEIRFVPKRVVTHLAPGFFDGIDIVQAVNDNFVEDVQTCLT